MCWFQRIKFFGLIGAAALLLASAHAQQKTSALTGVNWVPITGNGPPTSSSCGGTCSNLFLGLPYIDLTNNNTYVYTATGPVNGFLQTNASESSSVTRIIAGTNVTISPSGGTGAVTVNASGASITVNGGSALASPVNLENSASGAGQILFTNTSGSNVQATLQNTATTVNGQSCALGGSCTISTITVPSTTNLLEGNGSGGISNSNMNVASSAIPVTGTVFLSAMASGDGTATIVGSAGITASCAGPAAPCDLQQMNIPPCTTATTTTAVITSTQLTIPVANITCLSAPSVIAIQDNGPGEFVGISSITPGSGTSGTLNVNPGSGLGRSFWGTNAATSMASGATVVVVEQANSMSATSTPFFVLYGTGGINYNPASGTIGDLTGTVYAGATSFLAGITVSGQTVQLDGLNSNSVYSSQARIQNTNAGFNSQCEASSLLYNSSASEAWVWGVGTTNTFCTAGTDGVPANAFVFTPGPTIGNQPLDGTPAAGWLTNVGQFNVRAGYSANLITLTGTTPAINAADALQTITLSGNTTPTVTNITAGIKGLTIQVCQPATGGPFTWTWPAAFHGAVTVGTTADTCTVQVFDSFNGTTLFPENVGVTNVAP
jgi:hypothetical protein